LDIEITTTVAQEVLIILLRGSVGLYVHTVRVACRGLD
jgi:hypothetical protein